MQFEFRQGFTLFIRYNDFDQYSYHIQFSKSKFNRIRYDNYDDTWDVMSRPHHFHPKNKKEALMSEMVGIPELDIPKLIEIIKQFI